MGMSPRRQRHWRQRFEKCGLDGLLDAPRPGRPKKVGVEKESAILAATEQSPPARVTHWSTRRLARRVGVSDSTVRRLAQSRIAGASSAALHAQPGPGL